MNAGEMTFKERDLLKSTTLKITVKRGALHRHLLPFGLWVMKVGARIAGVGQIVVEDER